jgi:hypothetical protein
VDSPRSRFIKELVAEFVKGTDGLLQMPWDHGKALDFRQIASSIFLLERPLDSISNCPSHLVLMDWLKVEEEPAEQEKSRIREILQTVLNMVNSPYGRVFRQVAKKLAPVEFIFVLVFIGNLETRDKKTLADLIEGMRFYVRRKHKDVRSNTDVTKTLVKYLKRNVDRHDAQPHPSRSPSPAPPTTQATKTPAKRKRVPTPEGMEDDEDDETDRPETPKRTRTDLQPISNDGVDKLKDKLAQLESSTPTAAPAQPQPKTPYKFGPKSRTGQA